MSHLRSTKTTKEVIVPVETHKIHSTLPKYSLSLNDIVGYTYDIKSLVLVNVQNYIESIDVVVGGVKMMSYTRSEISNNENIFPEGHFMSKCTFHYTTLVFHYNKEYIEQRETYHYEDEYIEKEVISDTQEEFYDGYDYHFGYPVTRTRVASGEKIRVGHGIDVEVPQMNIILEYGDSKSQVGYWDSVLIDPSKDEDIEYVNKLVEKHEFHMKDGTCVDDAIKSGKPFYGRVKNYIRYVEQMAAKVYCF